MTTAQKPITEARLDAAVQEILEDIRELDNRLTAKMGEMENRILEEIRNGHKQVAE